MVPKSLQPLGAAKLLAKAASVFKLKGFRFQHESRPDILLRFFLFLKDFRLQSINLKIGILYPYFISFNPVFNLEIFDSRIVPGVGSNQNTFVNESRRRDKDIFQSNFLACLL